MPIAPRSPVQAAEANFRPPALQDLKPGFTASMKYCPQDGTPPPGPGTAVPVLVPAVGAWCWGRAGCGVSLPAHLFYTFFHLFYSSF